MLVIFFIIKLCREHQWIRLCKSGFAIEAAKAFERSTYQCVYIIDYHKQDFLYVSNNIARLCGEDAQKIKDFGYRFYIDYVPSEDLKMLLEINNSGFKLFETFPIGERTEYTILMISISRKTNVKGWLTISLPH